MARARRRSEVVRDGRLSALLGALATGGAPEDDPQFEVGREVDEATLNSRGDKQRVARPKRYLVPSPLEQAMAAGSEIEFVL